MTVCKILTSNCCMVHAAGLNLECRFTWFQISNDFDFMNHGPRTLEPFAQRQSAPVRAVEETYEPL